MLIRLSDVLSDRHQTIDETVQMEREAVRTKAGVFPIVRKDPVRVTVTHLKGRELRIDVQTKVCVLIPCDRCLEEVEQEFDLDFSKHVDLGDPGAELREGFDESFFIDGYDLDADQMLCSEILARWPTKVLCREDCRGICSKCGQNLNQGSCGCEDTSPDLRMSVVRDLFRNGKEV